MKPEKIYQVGDTVQIIYNEDCRFGWNDEMTKLSGAITKISEIFWDKSRKIWDYRLENCVWHWSDDCLIPACSIEEDTNEIDVSSLL